LIPENDFCAPEDLTDDISVIMGCVALKGESVCAPPCKWRRGRQAATEITSEVATNDVVDNNGPFFSKNICHPSSTQNFESESSKCLPITDAQTCTDEDCVWSDATALIPPQDFCAPTDMTNEYSVIDYCTDIKASADCF
jgi:hypothetical protein